MGASGSGKSTIQHSLPINFMTNYTTRQLRDGEVEGYHINQVTKEEFLHMKSLGYFFETTEYAGNYYGTPMQSIMSVYNGNPYHCTKDLNGMLELKNKLGDKAISVYIKSPSIDVLKQRMIERGDTLDDIEKRIRHLEETNELENEKYADHVIINDDLKDAQLEAHRIIIKELLNDGA